jgi:hypothetical protein
VAWGRATRVRKGNVLNEFMYSEIPTAWLERPDEHLESRLWHQDHSDEIQNLMKEKGLLNIQIEVLVYKHELVNAGIDPDAPDFDITGPKPKGVHFYSIVGAHSTTAALALHLNRPKHADWLICPVIMHVCEMTPENQALALVYGGLDNMVHDSQKKVDHWDVCARLHQARVNIKATGKPDKEQKVMWKKARADIKSSCQVKQIATMGTLEALSAHMGKTWKLLYKIMMGQCPDQKKVKIVKPANLAWTKDMSNIPEDFLERWLQRVVTGEFSAKDFLNRCNEFKKRQRVQNDITDYVNQLRPEECHKDFTSVARKYVALRDKDTFDTMVRWCGAVAKDRLTKHVQDSVYNILKDYDTLMGRDEEEVRIYFCFLYWCSIVNCVCV